MTSSDSILNRLATIDEAAALVRAGAPLCLAGAAEALEQLPAGNWIAGTIPYFMAGTGGAKSLDRVFVTQFPADWRVAFAAYTAEQTASLVANTPDNGFSLVISPCGCPALEHFALRGREVEGAFLKPVVGWVAGIDLDALGRQHPAIYLGSAPKPLADGFVAAHVTLPDGRLASLSIVNIFESDGGDVLHFPELGTAATHCLVNGERRGLADYLRERGDADGKLPLVGDFSGAAINVSIQSIAPDGTVTFYAPVFPDTDYHMARPVADYAEAFAEQFRAEGETEAPAFACNCILNYVHGGLEGRALGHIQGPVTFGEIAYQLLNQTLVRLHIH